MSDAKTNIGAIEWCDLTVNNAENIKDFYSDVVGWQSKAESMGEYDDYNIILPESGDTVAGICHARGSNSNLPAQWLMYVNVEDVKASANKCIALGGEVLDGPRTMCGKQFCVIKDPAGAVLALVSA
ncbi:VOC family protein [Litorilituus lipolyticus]|uniref:VOC family protein n=1 Tax=Litorilituus lipolyticus TaxID=2491017 RepID=A0A502KPG6_9GAMM|nr:VOC family protein [Litorilituus lipolyticus]TPH13386.1 VOC family protein [Litorilituus lipolyticus]